MDGDPVARPAESPPAPLHVHFGAISSDMPGGIPVTELALQRACAATGEIVVRAFPFGRRRPDESLLERSLERLAGWWRYAWLTLRERPDLVQLNTAFNRRALVRDVGYAFLARLLRQRLFLKLHGSDSDALATRSRFWRWMTRSTFAGAAGIGVLSSEEKHDFVAAGYPDDRFHVVKNAVDATPFARAVWPRPGPPRLLFIARMVEGKGLLDVVRAARILRDSGRDVRLTCVGDGPARRACEALAHELGLGEAVHFTGFVPEAQAARFYLESWILVLPSRAEGFSMSIFQAVAAGLPVLTTRIRAAADYLREPDNVLWVEPSDPERLAARAAWLLDHPDAMAAMSRNNRALASAFAAEIVAREYVALYRGLCAKPGRSAAHPLAAGGGTAAGRTPAGRRVAEGTPR